MQVPILAPKVGDGMDIYIKNEKEKGTFHFPVNPFEITVNRNKRYETADIVNLGEVDFSDKGTNIKELSMNLLLPVEYGPFCRYRSIPNPVSAIAKLEKWMNAEDPVRLIITKFNFNNLVIISNITESERGGEAGDKYVDISFRVWREVKVKKVAPRKTNNIMLKSRPQTKSAPKQYVVKKGDSLWKISVKFYGKGSQYTKIYNANRGIIGRNPNLIYPGQKLVIPK